MSIFRCALSPDFEFFENFDLFVGLSVCLWHRTSQTDEPKSMRFLLFESRLNREGWYEGGLMNKEEKAVTAFVDFK